ncbi:MAG: D-glycero-alpha-D-manno-heptose-7-phosphate kinase [Gaiellales bacterium]|nr:D-glycero-alpha-D-manno-heptose-7-phosphate kinase [Gaiellales bacterium]
MLNATIDRYAYGLLRPRKDRQIRIESADFGLSVNYAVDEPPIFDGRLDLVKAAIRSLGDPSSLGYDIFLHSNAPPGSGLGSSSTVMVTLIGLL